MRLAEIRVNYFLPLRSLLCQNAPMHSLKEAAALLGISTKVLRKWIKAGAIKQHRPKGCAPHISKAEISRVLGQPLP